MKKGEDHKFYRAYKYELSPSKVQKELLQKMFGCSRFIFNHFLKEKQEHYLLNKKTLNYNNCCSSLTILKSQPEYSWLNETNSQSLQASLKNLETAYGNFFSKRTSFPKFKSKHSKQSITIPQFIKIKGDKIYFPKFKEGIEFINHRKLNGTIKQCTITKQPSGKYQVSILCEATKPRPLEKTGNSIGIDLGLTHFIVTSDGEKINNPKFFRNKQKELKKAQQNLCRKQKDSKRREKARLKVAKIHEKITNSRNDLHHKLSLELVKKYDVIGVETLTVKNMTKNHKLAKSISDASWSGFIDKIKYKCEWYGKRLIQIDSFYPSSKTCSSCLFIKSKMDLSIRNWTCPSCGKDHDRDINAAKNIHTKALSIINDTSSGTDDYRHGANKTSIEGSSEPLLENGVEMSKKKRESPPKPLASC